MNRLFDVDDVIRTGGRMPGFASAMDAGKNIGASVNMGYSFFDGMFGGEGFGHMLDMKPFNFKSIGGMLTLGGAAIPGAVAGAAIGSFQYAGNPVQGAAIGAAVGGIGVPLAAGGALWGMSKLGGGIINAFKSTAMDEAGSGVIGTAGAGLGMAGLKAAKFGFNMLDSVPARGMYNMAGNFLNNLVDTSKIAEGLEHVKLSGPLTAMVNGFKEGEGALGKLAGVAKGTPGAILNGKTMFYGGAAIQAGRKMMDTYNQIHMGRSDGQITTATPRIPVYADNAGATGNLVFALNANRRG